VAFERSEQPAGGPPEAFPAQMHTRSFGYPQEELLIYKF